MFLLLLEMISNSHIMTTLLLLLQLYVMQEMKVRHDLVQSFHPNGNVIIPDLCFGFTSTELNQWYEQLGIEGRNAYLHMVALDFFPFMEVTPLVLGSFLYAQLITAQINPSIALIMPMAMIGDLLETYIVAYGCQTYSTKPSLPNHYVELASLGNQMKWILYATGLMLLSILFVYNTFLVIPKTNNKSSVVSNKKTN